MINPFYRSVKTMLLLLMPFIINAQVQQEIPPPYNIKTVSFRQSNENVYPFFRVGEPFQFTFDDLFGNEANYYYSLTHCNYNWTPSSQLTINDYIEGFEYC